MAFFGIFPLSRAGFILCAGYLSFHSPTFSIFISAGGNLLIHADRHPLGASSLCNPAAYFLHCRSNEGCTPLIQPTQTFSPCH